MKYAWLFEHGNAVVRQSGWNDGPAPAGGRFGWGSQFLMRLDEVDAGRTVLHVPITTPVRVADSPGGPFSRPRISRVAVQGEFGDQTSGSLGVGLRWIDVWERHNRVFTTSPEGPDGRRTNRIDLRGRFQDVFREPTSDADRASANVHRVATDVTQMPIAWGGIGVSLGFEVDFDRHLVTITAVGVEVVYAPE